MVKLTAMSLCQLASTKAFIETSSLLQRIFILLTTVTSCDDRLSTISLSLTPFKNRHLITPFDVLRVECGDTLIETLASKVDLRTIWNVLSVEQSINNDHF